MAAACRKLASRIAKYGALPTCDVHDGVWAAARLPVLCSMLAHVMIGRLSFSEHRHFVHSLLPKLLRPGDAFVVFQEPALASAAMAGKGASDDAAAFRGSHVMLVFVGDAESMDLHVPRCTNVLDFAWPACHGVPTYVLDMRSTPACDQVHIPDAAQMGRALANCAATFVTRPGGCVTSLFCASAALLSTAEVLRHAHDAVAAAFDLD